MKFVMLLLLFFTAPTALLAQDPCPANAPSAAFMSAASDIRYGCDYLMESTPPQFVLAASYFRQALAKEPTNATALVLLGISFTGMGEADSARVAFAAARKAGANVDQMTDALYQRRAALRPAATGDVAKPAPKTPPTPATPPATNPGMFAVGDSVDVEYRTGEWIPGVVTRADPGPCPYYRVRADAYGKGDPSTLGYVCGAVRARTGVAAPKAACGGSNPNCKPVAPPPLGKYICDITRWDVAEKRIKYDYQGYFELLPGGRYRWLDNGGTGRYAYNSTSHVVTWQSGPMVNRGGKAVYGLDGKTPEITIAMGGAVDWQCGLSK